jgi:hypothetical protein
MKIGDTIWRFEENRRIYPPKEKGRVFSSDSPIWREHWVAEKIVGETSRSWLVGFDLRAKWSLRKLPKVAFKDGRCPRGFALSQEHITKLEWVHNNHYRLSNEVNRCDDPDVLQEIARIVGYKELVGSN